MPIPISELAAISNRHVSVISVDPKTTIDEELRQQKVISPINSDTDEDDSDDNLLEDITEENNSIDNDIHDQKKRAAATAVINENSNTVDTSGNGSFRGRPSSCVFVASLASSLSDDELCISVTESFKKYGTLARVKVLRDPANRPYAFVQYINQKDAKKALKKAQGSILNGRTLRCEPARVNRTLFVTHDSPIPSTEVSQLCEEFGELEQLVPSRENNQFVKKYDYPIHNSNSWFVQFAYRDDAIRAFANLRSDLSWDVEWVQNIDVPKHYNLLPVKSRQGSDEDSDEDGDDDSETNEDEKINENDEFNTTATKQEDDVVIDKKSIFVGQLSRGTTKDSLEERFSTHGKIVDINLICKPTNVFAFIQYETEEAAAAALERENHAIFLNKTMHVQYKEVGGLHGRRNFRRNSNGFNNGPKHFNGPQFNLAPPPINMYRRRSLENDPMLQYMGPPIPGLTEYDINPYNNPYMRGSVSMRRKSLPTGWSSTRSYSFKSENDINNNVNIDTNSELSGSAGQAGSATTYNNSSAGSMSNTNNNGNNNNNNNIANVGNKRKYSKRASYTYNEPPKPYYFQPYYYPMHYPMGPMGHGGYPQGSAGNQPYMMVYPMPPPPPTGVDANMMVPPLPLGPSGTPPVNNATEFTKPEGFVTESKPYDLDY